MNCGGCAARRLCLDYVFDPDVRSEGGAAARKREPRFREVRDFPHIKAAKPQYRIRMEADDARSQNCATALTIGGTSYAKKINHSAVPDGFGDCNRLAQSLGKPSAQKHYSTGHSRDERIKNGQAERNRNSELEDAHLSPAIAQA
jgi:hypothetical protein